MPSRPWPPPSAAAAICLLGLVACSDIASAQWGKPPPLGAAEALPGVAGKPPWPPAGRPSSAAAKPAPGGQVAGALAGKPPPLPPGGGPFGGAAPAARGVPPPRAPASWSRPGG